MPQLQGMYLYPSTGALCLVPADPKVPRVKIDKPTPTVSGYYRRPASPLSGQCSLRGGNHTEVMARSRNPLRHRTKLSDQQA
ncbi:hypothetical protein N7453_007151 [Penicillium expansum]|nr:hypothetical protein N7453_007151 [Penicillium expansum]